MPDPVIIFLYLIVGLIAISVVCDLLGVSAVHPTQLDAAGNPKVENALSLLAAANMIAASGITTT